MMAASLPTTDSCLGLHAEMTHRTDSVSDIGEYTEWPGSVSDDPIMVSGDPSDFSLASLPLELCSDFEVQQQLIDRRALKMRLLWEITIHPGWDFIDLAEHLDLPFSEVAPAVEEMLREGLLSRAG